MSTPNSTRHRPMRGREILLGSLAGLLVVLVGGAALAAYRGGMVANAFHGRPAQPSVVIIILADALRADRLSSYGYTKSQTPHIDALARDGVRFSQAISQAPWTKPSVGTIFTGLVPLSHQARTKGAGLPDSVTTVAESLSAHNYATAAFMTNLTIRPGLGFEQGFDEYIWLPAEDSHFVLNGDKYYQEAELVTARVKSWLAGNRAQRMFLYVHYMDPHRPYFEQPYNGQGYYSHGQGDPAEAGRLGDLYDGEIRYLDTHVGDLIAELKKKGLYDQALIVFTADHGEEFYEHQGWGHGRTVYQEVIQVPLIVKYPGGWGAGTVDEHLVRSIDLAPTILDTAGIRPPATMQGVSLLQPAPPADEQVAFSETDFEGNVARAWVTPRDKLIQVVDGDPRGREAIQLYDLAADPGETLNLAQAHVGVVADLRRQMDRLMIAALEASVAGTEFEIDPETEQRLKLLGY